MVLLTVGLSGAASLWKPICPGVQTVSRRAVTDDFVVV